MKGRVLIVAGSDSSGGAGIQADIKTVSALGGYAMTAITAVTIQSTRGVAGVHAVPVEVIAAQMRVVLDDIGADIVKTGMLHEAGVIRVIAEVLAAKAPDIPLIVDPVMVSKSGAVLLMTDAVTALKKDILPRAALITPNLPEAQALLGYTIGSIAEMRDAAKKLGTLGAKAVLLKGGHLPGPVIHDFLWDGSELSEWSSPRIDSRHTHGTGCTLASAIATCVAQGLPLKAAVAAARDYVLGAIRNAPGFGHGAGPLNHGWMIKEKTQ